MGSAWAGCPVSQQPAQLYWSAFPSVQGSGESSANFTMGLRSKIVVSPRRQRRVNGQESWERPEKPVWATPSRI